jgi:hypothetical protein
MHFTGSGPGPPHLRAQASAAVAGVPHSELELRVCLHVAHEARVMRLMRRSQPEVSVVPMCGRPRQSDGHGSGHHTQNERELRSEHA